MRGRKTKKQKTLVLEILTMSASETKKLGALLAKIISTIEQHLMLLNVGADALVISLEGDLGSGKTMFAKGFAKGLGILETIKSPTFVILKKYQISHNAIAPRRHNAVMSTRKHYSSKALRRCRVFIHIDAYRIRARDLRTLGWRELIKNPRNIIFIEWGERVRAAFPKNHMRILFRHHKQNERIISFVAKQTK